MDEFMQKHAPDVNGSLSGFDRLVFRGTLRSLAVKSGMLDYLSRAGVLLKDFGSFVEQKSQQLKQSSLAEAQRLGRPVQYLRSPKLSKEELARNIAGANGITAGLICVLTVVEVCMSYEIFRDRQAKKLSLEPRTRKCLFLYHYWIDPLFGFISARIQTWFPFNIQVCLNGREWLARQMDRAGLRYERRDNCFPWMEDGAAAQRLMDEQLRTPWPSVLRAIARRLNPAHEAMFAPYQTDYYWTVHQSEWASDILFKSAAKLGAVYDKLTRNAIAVFGSDDVMRFLGRKLNGHFQGEVVSNYRRRPEGVRIKHCVKGNAIKAYDKQGSILRVETTINQPREFKVYRPKEGEPHGSLSWRPMRRGIADLHRRTEVSQAANSRYLQALAALSTDRRLREVVAPMCRPVRWRGKRVRALRPWSEPDRLLLEAISRGEFAIHGFRNRDLRQALHPGRCLPHVQRRLSSQTSYRLRLLRAHGLIRKAPRTKRYLLTKKGREMTTAILHVQHIPISKLTALAA